MKRVNRFFQILATNKPHRIIGAPVAIRPQAVDRHDSWMFQPSRDLRLDHEPLTALFVIRVLVVNLLDRDFAVQFGIKRDEYLAKASARVRSKDSKPLAFAGRGADRKRARFGRMALDR